MTLSRGLPHTHCEYIKTKIQFHAVAPKTPPPAPRSASPPSRATQGAACHPSLPTSCCRRRRRRCLLLHAAAALLLLRDSRACRSLMNNPLQFPDQSLKKSDATLPTVERNPRLPEEKCRERFPNDCLRNSKRFVLMVHDFIPFVFMAEIQADK